MTLTITKVVAAQPFGARRMAIYDVLFDNSYPAGGEAVTPGDFGLSQVIDTMFPAVAVASGSALHFAYDPTNKKIQAFSAIKKYTAALDPASMATDAASSKAVTVTGVAAADLVVAVQPAAALEAAIVAQSARATGANEVTVELSNLSAGTVDAASANADFYVVKANGGLSEIAASTDLSGYTVRLMVFGL